MNIVNFFHELIGHSTNLLFYFLSFILIISIVVFVHEFGHYIVAKLCNVKVIEFSIGFGPEIFGLNDKSGTRWKLSLIPVGGYVKMFGDSNAASMPDYNTKLTEEEKLLSFHEKPIYKKFLIILAGPLANIIFAIIVITALFSTQGTRRSLPIIGNVIQGSPAEKAGLSPQDTILTINGQNIKWFEDIIDYTMNNSNPELEINYLRNSISHTVKVIPQMTTRKDVFGNQISTSFLGIVSSGLPSYKKLPINQSFIEAVRDTNKIIRLTLKSIFQIISGSKSTEELGGPIRIAQYSGQSVKQGMLLWFIAMISINLGVVNLLPIPVLDGGHLFHYIILAVIRKKHLNVKYQEYAAFVGFILLLSIMVFATFNDIKNIFIR